MAVLPSPLRICFVVIGLYLLECINNRSLTSITTENRLQLIYQVIYDMICTKMTHENMTQTA